MLIENVDQLAYKARLQSDVYILYTSPYCLFITYLFFWLSICYQSRDVNLILRLILH